MASNLVHGPLLQVVASTSAEHLPQHVPAIQEPYIVREVCGQNPAVQVSKLFYGMRVVYARQWDYNQLADRDTITGSCDQIVVYADIVLRIHREP